MKLLIIGIGYVGSALLEYWKNGPHELFLTTTEPCRLEELSKYSKKVLLLTSDAKQALKELIDQCDGMIVLVAPKKGKSYEETYLGTAQTLTSLLKNRKDRFFLLYTSSTSVCQGAEENLVKEETLLCPVTESGKILLDTESLYLSLPVQTCILRLGGIYGPGRTLSNRAKMLSGKELDGTGEEVTNHVHLEDIIRGIDFCLRHSLSGIYHLVNDDHPTRKTLYFSLCQNLHIDPPIWKGISSSERKLGYSVCNEKIKNKGFVFSHRFIEKSEIDDC